ncbi:formyltetrahydrofolate deformylase [Alicyclobacillus tolerans]|uniref:formyltetrahydrofolate deformylase n=1 Tax=Alicyclobacillus tolerans TaxID=90970 RepID=UPI001F02C9F4|nr:formyltetrahydrofolate deformylase [Alicyclobacillus tolerans]MCF8563938.1 formyltetrahydrofolate deformylase [Alicyclobacillus tolerans]
MSNETSFEKPANLTQDQKPELASKQAQASRSERRSELANRARLLISCPDRPGIVAAVAQFLYRHQANIVQSDQHSTNPETGLFFMRIEFDLVDIEQQLPRIRTEFAEIANTFRMSWRIEQASIPKRIAIFASKEDHCLLELLWQWQAGDLFADIAMVVSNHNEAKDMVERLGIPFHYIPVDKTNKTQAEFEQQSLLAGKVDLVVLARYMQILSAQFVDLYPGKIINIHHSFLPAFIGRNPYTRAYERGVKLIGATAHYVTAELDQGPIIEQDVHRVDHKNEAEDLKRIGRHVERTVLARAVKWHLEDRILIHENKTIVFA